MADRPIAEVLAEERARAERLEATHEGPYVRSRRAPNDPSQVYSLRVPLSRLEAIRQLAASHNTTPAALLRSWVMERLDQETQRPEGDVPASQRERALALMRQLEATLLKQ